jgi:hypothetical protein
VERSKKRVAVGIFLLLFSAFLFISLLDFKTGRVGLFFKRELLNLIVSVIKILIVIASILLFLRSALFIASGSNPFL